MAFKVGKYNNMKVSVFGNPDLEKDNLVVKLLPKLKKEFPKVEFRLEDPVEGLKPPPAATEWVILDVAVGINKIRVFKNIDKLATEKRVSLHDYGVAMELKLLRKLGKVKRIKIIVVPVEMEEKRAFKGVIGVLREIIPRELRHKY